MKRRSFITLLGGAAATWPVAARAQQSPLPVLGFLNAATPDTFPDRMRAYRQGLSQAGFDDGRNVVIEYRWANNYNERLPALAADLVRRKVAVIAAVGGAPAVLAAKAATTDIPIVFQIGIDPIELKIVSSLARPSGNLTGVSSLNSDVTAKRLELMHEVVPAATKMALLVNPANPAGTDIMMREAGKAARTLNVDLQVLRASSEREIETAFSTLVQEGARGVVIAQDAFFTGRNEQLAALALQHKLPTVSPYREFPAAGGLMSYGGDITESWRLAGMYAGRVLKGEKPADLPVEQSTKVELVISMKTAKALGMTLPITLLGRADEVIE